MPHSGGGTYIRPMKKIGGGIGIVMLLVVLAVVLFLAGRSWQSVSPTAEQLRNNPEEHLVDKYRDEQPEAVDALGTLPNLDDMRSSTGAHADRLQQALDQTE